MMRKKVVGFLMLVMCVLLSLGALTACNGTPEKPEGGSWTCYSENKIWTKNLMLKFEDEETFKVYSGNDVWITGNYKFKKDPGTSTLTLWNADVAIPDVEKDGEKTYEPKNGVYTIEFDHGSGGKSKFLFQPPQDGTKPGEETNQPKPPCDTHVDANGDGKCDNCGADMPATPPSEKEVSLTLKSEANSEGQIGRILLYNDNTWEFSICFYGNTYNPMCSGTYATRQDWSAMDLTATDDQANVLGGNNIVISIDASNQADIKYTTTVNCNIPQVGERSFALNKVANEENPTSPTPPTPPTPSEGKLKSEEASFWGGVGKAYFEFDTTENTFDINVDAGQGFSAWLSGTYTLADNKLSLTATWPNEDGTYLEGATSGVAKEYTANNGTYVIGVVFPSAGTVNIKFIPDPDAVKEQKQYVVTFDFGNGTTIKALTSAFETKDGTIKQYVPVESAPKAPYIRGKRFAGWDTSENPVLQDGVSTTKFLLGVNVNSYFDTGAIEKDVMEVTENTTLYARWVEPTAVSTEEELRNMKNDLSGWYILKNNITLTQEWFPVGTYYASYEHLTPNWWKYAFSGQLDGNGYTISGLSITTLTPYGETVHPVDGSGNGTTALFGSICDEAEISELFIENPVVNITDYKDANHGYVSLLAAFVQGSPKIHDVHIKNASITVTTERVNYLAVCALLAGHWGGEMKNCTASGSITVNAKYTTDYTGEGTNLYVGGLVGEGYGWVTACKSDMTVTLNVTDPRAAQDKAVHNIYMGSIGASVAYTDNIHAGGSVVLDYSKVDNITVSAYVGGIGGIQRNGYLDYSTVDASISIKTNSKSTVKFVGSLLGGYDAITTITNLHGLNDMKVRCCIDKGVVYTLDEQAQAVEFIGFVPTTQADMAMAEMIAGYMGVDLTPYKDTDGNYIIYGTDRCTKESV